jgi:hypothetical protein
METNGNGRFGGRIALPDRPGCRDRQVNRHLMLWIPTDS